MATSVVTCHDPDFLLHAKAKFKRSNMFRKANQSEHIIIKSKDNLQFTVLKPVVEFCPYFKSLKEIGDHGLTVQEIETNIVQLTTIPGDILDKILDYLYVGEVDITMDEIRDMLEAASYLLLTFLANFCLEEIKKSINRGNVMELIEYGESRGSVTKDIYTGCIKWMLYNAEELVEDDFVQLLKLSHIEALLDFDRRRHNLSEEKLFALIEKWYKVTEEGKREFKNVAAKLQFDRMSADFLRTNVIKDDLLSELCTSGITAQKIIKLTSSYIHPEYPQNIIIWDNGNTTFKINFLEKKLDKVTRLGNMYHSAICYYENKLIRFGGQPNNEWIASCEEYDMVEKEFKALPPMPRGLYFPSVVHLNDKFYLFSRNDGNANVGTMLCFDYKEQKWMSEVNFKLEYKKSYLYYYDPSICSSPEGNSFFLYDNGNLLRYNLAENEWKEIGKSEKSKTACCQILIHRNVLYAINDDNIETFDIKENKFVQYVPLNLPGDDFNRKKAALLLDNKTLLLTNGKYCLKMKIKQDKMVLDETFNFSNQSNGLGANGCAQFTY